MSYKMWVWRKEGYELKKIYRYKNDMKNEIELEIVKMNDDKRAECSERMSKREGVISPILILFKNRLFKDLENQDNLRQKDKIY